MFKPHSEGSVAKAHRARSLVDSIQELLDQYHEVSNLLDQGSYNGKEVMVPLTPVAFMPATICSPNVTVHIGENYFVPRKPHQAKQIIERRIQDLYHGFAELEQHGAYGSARSTLNIDNISRTMHEADSKVVARNATAGSRVGYPCAEPVDEVKPEDLERMKEKSGGPIVEIREWLNDMGREVSAEVTELGKVLKPSKVAEMKSSGGSIHKQVSGVAQEGVRTQKEGHVEGSSPKDLDKLFARLEQQEAEAEEDKKQGREQLLGSQWKKGFLDSKSNSQHAKNVGEKGVQAGPVHRKACVENETTQSKTQAFSGRIMEKISQPSLAMPQPSDATRSFSLATPARVSRFKARRQGT
ncbi:unnamed protein product [Discosporangium mesarthrocarpum]